MLSRYCNFKCLRLGYTRFFGRGDGLSIDRSSFLFSGVIHTYFTLLCNHRIVNLNCRRERVWDIEAEVKITSSINE